MKKKIPTDVNFEQSLLSLEDIVAKMEGGKLNLEDSLTQFEAGIILAKQCEELLKHSEQKVQMLIKKNDLQQTIDFSEHEE